MKVWKQEEWVDVAGPDMAFETVFPVEKSASGLEPAEAKAAREKAVYYLQFSGKTENELRKKLAEKEFSPASINYAIDFVKKYRYLDDGDYARRFIEKNSQKKSRKQIVYELTQKGISRDILDQVLEDVPVDEEMQIIALLEKRGYSGESATKEEKQKILYRPTHPNAEELDLVYGKIKG